MNIGVGAIVVGEEDFVAVHEQKFEETPRLSVVPQKKPWGEQFQEIQEIGDAAAKAEHKERDPFGQLIEENLEAITLFLNVAGPFGLPTLIFYSPAIELFAPYLLRK